MPKTTPFTAEDLLVIENVMKATGLTHAEAARLLLMDAELDEECDAALCETGPAEIR